MCPHGRFFDASPSRCSVKYKPHRGDDHLDPGHDAAHKRKGSGVNERHGTHIKSLLQINGLWPSDKAKFWSARWPYFPAPS